MDGREEPGHDGKGDPFHPPSSGVTRVAEKGAHPSVFPRFEMETPSPPPYRLGPVNGSVLDRPPSTGNA